MAGIEGERPHGERTSHQASQPEQTQSWQGRAEGRASLQGPTTVDRSEQLQSQPGSTLSRAVERTRDLYESNGWVFVPLGEAGKGSPSLSNPQAELPPQPQTRPQEQPKTKQNEPMVTGEYRYLPTREETKRLLRDLTEKY